MLMSLNFYIKTEKKNFIIWESVQPYKNISLGIKIKQLEKGYDIK